MSYVILGAAGFIGTNLAIYLSKEVSGDVVRVDQKKDYFDGAPEISNTQIKILDYAMQDSSFDSVVNENDVVFHLISTNNPTTSNKTISSDLTDNITITLKLLDTCVRKKAKRIVFVSSGGTVYGPEAEIPIAETEETNPINTYGIQKITIEKLLFLYKHMYGLDYKIIRLSNPYGPYQRPNGKLGVISTFIYKASRGEVLNVYGDGSVIRDYIYIDDAIKGIVNISKDYSQYTIFNLGSGIGTSVNEIIQLIKLSLNKYVEVKYEESRTVDVPVNILNVKRYTEVFGERPLKIKLSEGIELTKRFFNHEKNN